MFCKELEGMNAGREETRGFEKRCCRIIQCSVHGFGLAVITLNVSGGSRSPEIVL